MRRQQFVVKRQGPLAIHLVPYSEHSSYTELQEYVRFLKPKQLVPTVGVGGDANGKKRDAILKHFRGLVDETASKARYAQEEYVSRVDCVIACAHATQVPGNAAASSRPRCRCTHDA